MGPDPAYPPRATIIPAGRVRRFPRRALPTRVRRAPARRGRSVGSIFWIRPPKRTAKLCLPYVVGVWGLRLHSEDGASLKSQNERREGTSLPSSTVSGDALMQRRAASVARGVATAHPVFVDRGSGALVW